MGMRLFPILRHLFACLKMVLIVVPLVYIFIFHCIFRGSLLLAKYNKIAVRHFVCCVFASVCLFAFVLVFGFG